MLKLGFKEDVEKVMSTIKEKGPKDIQVLLFSATVPVWVKKMAENFLAPNFSMIDLAQNLKNKTSKTVRHLAINCPYHNRISALADIRNYLYKLISFSCMLWRCWTDHCFLQY